MIERRTFIKGLAHRIESLEQHVRSVDELRAALRGLKAGEGDAIFVLSDAMVASHFQLIVETAKAQKLPTMFTERTSVATGGLASYGATYHAVGRALAKYVHRVLLGTSPEHLPDDPAVGAGPGRRDHPVMDPRELMP